MTDKNKKMDEARELVVSCLELQADGLEKSLEPLKAYLATFTPDAMKDEDTREAFLKIMSFYEGNKGLVDQMRESVKIFREAISKPAEGGAISSFGFLSGEKKAA